MQAREGSWSSLRRPSTVQDASHKALMSTGKLQQPWIHGAPGLMEHCTDI